MVIMVYYGFKKLYICLCIFFFGLLPILGPSHQGFFTGKLAQMKNVIQLLFPCLSSALPNSLISIDAIFSQVIAAEGEQNASRALKEASDVISSSPAALQLRYLQTLTQVSAEKNSTIIFPLPIELLSAFIKK